MDKSKPFGLVIPKKAKAFQPKTRGVFGSDSDDDPAPKKRSSKIPQSKPISALVVKTEELVDPTIYEYDSIYDDMKAQKSAEIVPKEKKSSRYIDRLLKAADKRKKEFERRVEKKVQSEREKEGDEFKDKEMFVSATYKKKLLEREEEEERERRENQLNDMMDVTKQKDLSGFYRHFLKQSVGEEKIPEFGEKFSIKEEPRSESDGEQTHIAAEKATPKPDSVPDDRDYSDSDDSSSSEESASGGKNSYEKSQRVREYRKRPKEDSSEEETSNIKSKSLKEQRTSLHKVSHEENVDVSHSLKSYKRPKDSLDEDEGKQSKRFKKSSKSTKEDEKMPDNSQKDLITSIISNNSEAEEDEKSSKKYKKTVNQDCDSSNVSDSSDEDNEQLPSSFVSENGVKDQKGNSEKDDSKKSRNIFQKRTVGDIFAAAQVRYFQRLASHSSA